MPSTELVALLAAAAVLPVSIGILVYVAGSFLLMRRHVAGRPLGRHLGEALREIGWAALTQPLLPLFYFVGRRMAGGRGTPIVVVHGYTQNRVDFLRLARACARAGLGPVYGFNYPWFATVDGNARRLARFCERVRAETGAAALDLVAHSLGGLVALEYVHEGGAAGVRRLVTVASPHAGVTWEGPIVGACAPQLRAGGAFLVRRAKRTIPVPSLSVYSTHDNVVHPPATSTLRARGGRDRVVDHVGHLSILFDPGVARAVVEFLGGRESAAAEYQAAQ